MRSGTRSAAGGQENRFLTALMAVCLVGYLPFLSGGWLTDDFVHLTQIQRQPNLITSVLIPNSFHFYRPVLQLTLWAQAHLFHSDPISYRALNWVLHVAVVGSVFCLAQLLLRTRRAALLAALAFVLTPKAGPIAVLWVSARSELLMSLFSVGAIICWLKWDAKHRLGWLAGAWITYALSVLSKETAVLLPVLLFVTPVQRPLFTKRRCAAVGLMVVTAVGILAWRVHVGGAMPTTLDAHYALTTPPSRWLRNLEVYLPRAIPSPLGMIVFVALPALILQRGDRVPMRERLATFLPQALFAVACFLVYIAPVIPIQARSELYLYFPAIGFCVLVGSIADAMMEPAGMRGIGYLTLSIYTVIFGGYQLSRSRILHEDLLFSSRLMTEIRQVLSGYAGPVVLVPADVRTAQFLSDSVWGYGDLMLTIATGRADVSGTIDYAHHGGPPTALRLDCQYSGAHVIIVRQPR